MEKYVIFKGLPPFNGKISEGDGRLNILNGVPYLVIDEQAENLGFTITEDSVAVRNTSGNNRGVAFFDKRAILKYVTKEEHPEYFL